MYSVLFHAAEESAALAGAKGLNLIKLNNHGLPVPDGFIIKTNSFASFLSYHNLQPAEQNLADKIKEASFPSTNGSRAAFVLSILAEDLSLSCSQVLFCC